MTGPLTPGDPAQSVIDRPLHERHKLLQQAVREAPAEGYPLGGSPVHGRIVILTPGCIMPSGRPGSTICSTVQEVERLSQEAVDNQVGSFQVRYHCSSTSHVSCLLLSCGQILCFLMLALPRRSCPSGRPISQLDRWIAQDTARKLPCSTVLLDNGHSPAADPNTERTLWSRRRAS